MAMNKETRKKFKAIFDQFDSNGDGTLTHVEFRSALDNIGYCLSDADLKVTRTRDIFY
jgi:Ca2+-binding EF-hand superfamily protein